ncbi:MAG: recombinase family protein [Gaiellaceae bacterium]
MNPEVAAFAELAVVRQAPRVKRLAYTRTQAAQALGISTSTFERRILPFIETVQMDWGKRFIPVDELERFLAARRQPARAELRRPVPPGRKPGLPVEVVARIRKERAQGKSLRRIAEGLNTDQVRTSQGGRQWWPSTVRAVLVRPNPLDPGQASSS